MSGQARGIWCTLLRRMWFCAPSELAASLQASTAPSCAWQEHQLSEGSTVAGAHTHDVFKQVGICRRGKDGIVRHQGVLHAPPAGQRAALSAAYACPCQACCLAGCMTCSSSSIAACTRRVPDV